MSSTDKEKKMIKDWAVKSESRIEGYDKDRTSYWFECDEGNDIDEYDFSTVPELKKALGENVKGCEDVILPLCVAAFKKKEEFRVETEVKVDKNSGDFSIPEFIYVF